MKKHKIVFWGWMCWCHSLRISSWLLCINADFGAQHWNCVTGCKLLYLNERSIVALFQSLIGLPLIRQVKAQSCIIPGRGSACFCLCANNSHKVWSLQSVKILLINISLFSFCLLFISSNYYSKRGSVSRQALREKEIKRQWGNICVSTLPQICISFLTMASK